MCIIKNNEILNFLNHSNCVNVINLVNLSIYENVKLKDSFYVEWIMDYLIFYLKKGIRYFAYKNEILVADLFVFYLITI